MSEEGMTSPVSLVDGTLAGWVKPVAEEPAAPAIGEALPSEPSFLNLSTAGHDAEPDAMVAFRWASIYKNDFEFKPFFDWIGQRSNPERTDFHLILESIPMRWGPEDLPPPLRRYFLRKFATGG